MFSIRKLASRLLVMLLVLAILPMHASAQAQSGLRVKLYAPDLSEFPKITLFLDAYDAQGNFITTLDLNSFRVLEDGFPRDLNESQILESGLHTIIAFNLGATLSNRANTSLPTQYEATVFALTDWVAAQSLNVPNQYSLTSNEGILAENVQDGPVFASTLQNYKPNLFNFQPDFSSLSLALDIAAKPSLVPLSKRAILYITPLPLDQELGQLTALRSRAREIGVAVNVWLVAPETAINAPATLALNELAVLSGGKFNFYLEDGQPPDPETDLAALRGIYRLRYTSGANQSGGHSVRVEVTYGNQNASTEDVPFDVSLNLPGAQFINLPSEIVRGFETINGQRRLQPSVATLQAAFIFPDGFERQLKATRLYVDGQVVDENVAPPFDYFGWPLDGYTVSADHLLAVEVEDILGFRSISEPLPVRLTVQNPYPGWMGGMLRFLNQGGWMVLLVIALAGFIIIASSIRRRMAATADGSISFPGFEFSDPLSQSVPGIESSSISSSEAEEDDLARSASANRRQAGDSLQPPRLVWTGSGQPPSQQKIISIDRPQLVIGSDPEQADVVFNAEGVSTQHFCLVRRESGAVSIADLGSESGTWVNYTPVSSAGLVLNQGDLIQVGDLLYRYQIGNGA